ncbi:hypothetical protein [Adhaeribacter pallidiroseus]|nr:hypothetical protein [Adhaeribacter pallidiroseus]
MVLFLFACDPAEDNSPKRLQIESIGFSGTLPEGMDFGKTGLVATNAVGGSANSQDGSFIYHGLVITDTLSNVSISMDLPQVKYSPAFILGHEDDGSELKQIARQYYAYDKVKQKLRMGDKILYGFNTANADTSSFGIQIHNNTNYTGFVSQGPNQTGSFLKVVELVEGTEPDPVLGSVKTLEVIFDLDIKMYDPQSAVPKPPTKMTGLLRMKYREF